MAFDQVPKAETTASHAGAGIPAFAQMDRDFRGRIAALMGGQSPSAAFQAWSDWAYHLAISPAKQMDLCRQASEAALALWRQVSADGPMDAWAFRPEQADRRFRHPSWTRRPYALFAQTQLAMEAQWRAATSGVRGVEKHHARRVEFLGRFALNALAPVNFACTNPEVVDAALRTGGRNFVAGAALWAEDVARYTRGERLAGIDAFKAGETVAITPGRVVFRNKLIELIQYAPASPDVRREPILITPAWIMKYYILDLTPANSLVRYLVEQGFTVFIISWKNPGAELRDTTFEDYRREGVMAAIDTVSGIVPGEKIHAVGYCLGGTVLAIAAAAIAAAAMERDGDKRLASLTLLAAQIDFEEAGELMLFIDESQLSLLEDMMHVKGYLDASQMSGAFYALRSNELLFAKMVERYLLGEPARPTDLDAWLTDATRMPAQMHSDYLRRLFLENSFVDGTYQVDGRAVTPKDIQTPIFALGAERDHIAPWQSVYKIELFGAADTTFLLTGGGHNSSVVSPPGKPHAHYRVGESRARSRYVEPEAWAAAAKPHEGSWWPEWIGWLDRRSHADRVAARPVAIGGAAAPGAYVLEA